LQPEPPYYNDNWKVCMHIILFIIIIIIIIIIRRNITCTSQSCDVRDNICYDYFNNNIQYNTDHASQSSHAWADMINDSPLRELILWYCV
jgi:hypothetical protein